jgi:hypothetical protein
VFFILKTVIVALDNLCIAPLLEFTLLKFTLPKFTLLGFTLLNFALNFPFVGFYPLIGIQLVGSYRIQGPRERNHSLESI